MIPAQTRQAAELLWRHWCTGTVIDELPESCRPLSVEQGYAVQAALAEVCGDGVVGWKIAATSEAGQRHINVDSPLAGRLFASKLHRSGAALSIEGNRMRVAEAEFAFVLGTALPPTETHYEQQEVMRCVEALHIAIELPNSRFADFTAAGAPQLAADDACAHLFVLGPAVASDWRAVDLAQHAVSVTVNGDVATRGRGSDVLGDPRAALTWIANAHRLRGQGLAPGDIVTTGVCGRPVPIAAGDEVVAEFGPFGQVSVSLYA